MCICICNVGRCVFVCVEVYICVHDHVHMCVWIPEIDTEGLPWLLLPLYTEAGSLTWTQGSTDFANLTRQLAARILTLLSELVITGGLPFLPHVYVGARDLNPSPQACMANWSVFPVSVLFSLRPDQKFPNLQCLLMKDNGKSAAVTPFCRAVLQKY